MAEDGHTLLEAAATLRAALEGAGTALAAPDVDALLRSEAGLAAALAILPSTGAASGGSREEVLRELTRAQAALTRCRRLGGALSEIARLSLGTQGTSGYARDGRQQARRRAGALKARG